MTTEEQAKVNEIAVRILQKEAKYRITQSAAFNTEDEEYLLMLCKRLDNRLQEAIEEYEELRERTEE